MNKLFELLSKRQATELLFAKPIVSIGSSRVMNTHCDCDCTSQGNCNCSRCDW